MRKTFLCLGLALATSGCAGPDEAPAGAEQSVTVRWSQVGWALVGAPDVREARTSPELAARIDRAERELAEVRPCCGARAEEIARQLARDVASLLGR